MLAKLFSPLRRWIIAAAALPVVGAVILRVTADIEAGSAADWTAALATIGALIAAMVAAHFTAEQLRIEDAREDARLLADKQSQAALVSAWPIDIDWRSSQDPYTGAMTEEVGVLAGVKTRVRNASDAPVTRVKVDVSVVVQKPGRDAVRYDVGRRDDLPLLPPGELKDMWVDASEVSSIPEPEDGVDRVWAEVQVYFADSVGREWTRLPVGELLLISEPTPATTATRVRS